MNSKYKREKSCNVKMSQVVQKMDQSEGDRFSGYAEDIAFAERYNTIETASKCSRGCLTKDTLILMADGTEKMICDINIGDEVRGKDYVIWRVSDIVSGVDTAIIRITTQTSCIKLTEKHPMMTKEGIKLAEDISVSDQLLSMSGEFVEVIDITTVEYLDKSYNLSLMNLEYNHMEQGFLIANGFVVGDLMLQNQMINK